jgi:hypothetical protein
MPLTTPTPSAAVASTIAERLPSFTYAQGASVIFCDAPRRGEPGIYQARNGELALATQGTTEVQRAFLVEIFQSEFSRYDGQDALYFTTQCPVLHVPSYLASSSTIEHKATSEPVIADYIPRLTKLAEIVPLLSQGQPFATVESSILDAIFDWCKPGFNWPDWVQSDEATKLHDTDLLDHATPVQLEKLLTAIVRKERFLGGTIKSAYKSKLLLRIAQRAAAILQLA